MKNFDLSDNFTFYEMTNSTEHPGLVKSNREACYKNPEHIVNLTETALLLQDVRNIHNHKTVVLSGYRFPGLNKAVGGSETSQHPYGQAGDFTVPSLLEEDKMRWLYETIRKSGIKFHQLIYYPEQGFIHISTPTGETDMQAWIKGEDNE